MALTPLNFPNAPTLGQTYPSPPVTGQPTYIWDGADWLSYFALGKAYVPLDGSQPMTGLLTLSGDPTAALNAGTKQYIDAGDLALAVAFTLPGYLFGLTMSTPGASNTLTVAPGVACNSTGARLMKLAAVTAKTTASWVAGSAAGGLDTGAIAASTWYHWYLILNPTTNVVDVVFSATATPANGPTLMPSGYTLFRRIGSMKTNASSQWIAFSQNGDDFLWLTPISDASSAATSTVAALRTLTVPPGVNVFAKGIANLAITSSGNFITFYAPDMGTQISNSPAAYITINCNLANQSSSADLTIRTDTSARIGVVAGVNATGVYGFVTYGWIDRRGRDA